MNYFAFELMNMRSYMYDLSPLCLLLACCAAITELVLDDAAAHNVVQVTETLTPVISSNSFL